MTELTLDVAPLTPADVPQIEKLDERAFGANHQNPRAGEAVHGNRIVAPGRFAEELGRFCLVFFKASAIEGQAVREGHA